MGALKRLITAPLRMSRKQAIILIVLLVIFAGALYLRLSVTLGYGLPLGRDGPYQLFHLGYLVDHWPSTHAGVGTTHMLFFHFAAGVHAILSAFGSSLMTSFDIATALASALVAPTTFLMMRRFTKNSVTALVAAFFSVFIPASLRMMGELQKNALGVALGPLFMLFLWRGLEGGKKLDLLIAGVVLGVVGLTHELVFGTLVIAYVSYLAFLLAYRRRIPWRELKAAIIIAIPVALICGYFYVGKLGTIGGMMGEGQAATLMVQGEQQLPEGQPMGPTIYNFYDEYIGQILLVFAAIGAGVAAYRRKPTDFFLLAWGMSALIMAQPWVVHDYQWRFALMLATPMALLAALGLVEGIGRLLWRAGKNIRALFSRRRLKKSREIFMWAGRVTFLCLLLFVVAYQAHVSHIYARTGAQLQPSITMEDYNALIKFQENFGSVYVFGGDADFYYWPDAVGLKGGIQGEGVMQHLSPILGSRQDAARLAVEWYREQKRVEEKIYALSGMRGREQALVLENEDLFVLVFSHSTLEVYALRENFRPPEDYLSSGPRSGILALAAAQPPPDNQQPPEGQGGLPPKPREEEPLTLKILLAPVYLIPGAARFVVGVPLTVLLWVFLSCLAWELVRRAGKSSERLRKVLVACVVVILVLAVVLVVGGYTPPMQPGPGMLSGPYLP